MEIYRDEIIVEGKPAVFYSLKIDNKVLVLEGKFPKIARIRDEWFEDVENPDLIIEALKKVDLKPDLFTFVQRPPEIDPKYDYYMEKQKLTALHITTFNDWWEKQLPSETRKKAKRAAKRGVDIRIAEFNDELVRGISGLFNDSPVRQGKPFWHYGKSFETVKKEMSLDLERCDFIGAYHNQELVGMVKLLYAGKIAEPVTILSKGAYQDKYVNNALIAKAVEMCAKKGIAYFFYGPYWKRGSMADWLRRHGFERMQVPRYYIPLTMKGAFILKARLHRSIKEMIPEKVIVQLINLRTNWYLRKYRNGENAKKELGKDS